MVNKREESLRQLFNDLTNKTFVDFKYYKLKFNDIAEDLLKFLLLSTIVNDKQITIGMSDNNGNKNSYLTLDRFDTETMLHLKLNENSKFKIELIYWDLDQNYIVHKYNFKSEEIEIIPVGLINIMNEVYHSEEPKTINANSIQVKK